MKKTTVYLPDDLKRGVESAAKSLGTSEAEVIRRSIAASVAVPRPALRPGILESEDLTSDRVDELLRGFGA